MFTGIIEQQGIVLINKFNAKAHRLQISACFSGLQIGESIAINGVCLTLVAIDPENASETLAFDISPETLSLTTLGRLKPGDKVNLERAMSANARFGGHYVSGHVDTKAFIREKKKIGDYLEITIKDFGIPAKSYLLPKGSISIEGISLTINTVEEETIKLMLIPHTIENTTLGAMEVGQAVNIEFDYFTRIVVHQLSLSGHLKKEAAL